MAFVLKTNDSLIHGPFAPLKAPGSKSVCNRALLLAAMAEGTSELREGLEADDTRAMRACLESLGIVLHQEPGTWRIRGGTPPRPGSPLPAGASGTTLRFLLPWLAVSAEEPACFEGDARLFERPLGGLLEALASLGASWEPGPRGGTLRPAPRRPRSLDLAVDPTASSQFLSGLAMAAASLPEGGRLRWHRHPISASYLELTAHWMARFGCTTRLHAEGWDIPGGALEARTLRIPGDWSGAAAFLCATAVTGRAAEVASLDPQDPQGDRAILPILESAGLRSRWIASDRLLLQGPMVRGFAWDLESCPDLGPVLAATAALAPGPSEFTGLRTLPLKECDRLQASADLVRWLGGTARIVGDHTLQITPGPCPGDRPPFDPRNDHRMAFAAAVGALLCGGQLLDPACVAKTLPTFWEDWDAMLDLAR